MCETNGHPICGQYSHLCQQPPETAKFTHTGSGSPELTDWPQCHKTAGMGENDSKGWGKEHEDFKSTRHLPQCEKWSREILSSDGFGLPGTYQDLFVSTAGNFIPSAQRSLHGSTNLYAPDLNNRPFVLHRVYANAQPRLRPVVSRSRTPPTNVPLVDAQLLFDLKNYTIWRPELAEFPGAGQVEWNPETLEMEAVGLDNTINGNWTVWRVDYPCLPEYGPSECAGEPGSLVAPKLRAFSNGAAGVGAVIKHVIQPVLNPIQWDPGPEPENITWQNARVSEGYIDVGSMWCVSSVSIDGDAGGVGYKVNDEFYFDFYETPARGGEMRTPISDSYQRVRVTSVNQAGKITGLQLYPPPVAGSECPAYTTTYGRLLNHRSAVAIAGTGYVEGDILEWNCVDGKPSGSGEFPYAKTSLGCRTTTKARATVTEVDCRGGIVDWFMCGAQNIFDAYAAAPPPCVPPNRDDRGEYSDIQYLYRCDYYYVGFLPVRYSYAFEEYGAGGDDPCKPCCRVGPPPRNYMPSASKACGPAYLQFNYTISKISVQNRVEISEPFPGGSRALAKITAITPAAREVETGYDCPKKIHDWAYHLDYPDYIFPENIPQGGVFTISLLKKGSGYARKNEDDSVEVKDVKVKITAVFDPPVLPPWIEPGPYDERWRGRGDSGFHKCQASAVIDSDPESDTFGQITSITITEPGRYYFAEAHDHVWVATAGTQFEPYLDYAPAPITASDGGLYDPPEDWDIHNGLLDFRRRRHSYRRNWGRAEHKDGFVERCGQKTSCTSLWQVSGTNDYWGYFGVEAYYNKTLTKNPGNEVMGNYNKRWSKEYCPAGLLNVSFDMVWKQHYLPNLEDATARYGLGYVPNSCGNYGVYCSGRASGQGFYERDYDEAGWYDAFTQVWESMGKGPIRFRIDNIPTNDDGNVTEEAP